MIRANRRRRTRSEKGSHEGVRATGQAVRTAPHAAAALDQFENPLCENPLDTPIVKPYSYALCVTVWLHIQAQRFLPH
jgi:hypothetical protein